MSQDAADFLTAFMWANEEQMPDLAGKTIYDFTAEFSGAVELFCSGFREFCEWRGAEIPDCERSFGGNVYFSLSGHGVGFWDSSDTEHLQPELVEFSGNKYRFEGLDVSENEEGEIDLAFIPSAIEKYREKTFGFAPYNSVAV